MAKANARTKPINPEPQAPNEHTTTVNSSVTNGAANNEPGAFQLFPVEWAELVTNSILFQRKILGMFGDRHRNINAECGYPETESVTAHHYKKIYERDPIGARIVNILPQECWRVSPYLYESDDLEETTEFEKAWDKVTKNLASLGVFKDKEYNPIWSYLERVDCLSGIGRYGVLLLGIDDGRRLNEPLKLIDYKSAVTELGNNIASVVPTTSTESTIRPRGSNGPARKLLFIRSLDETMATVATYDMNESSVRFGLPETYNVCVVPPATNANDTPSADTTLTTLVHWTRIVHIADNLQSNEIFGIPRMQIPYNRLYDLHKLYGGSAEMYWQGAFPGLSFEGAPELIGAKIDAEGMLRQLELWREGLQRHFAPAPGITVKSIAPQVIDPTPHIERQLEAICILIGVPKRVFMGSEVGELASGQDSERWNGRCKKRQTSYITPGLIVPFVDRLIQAGVLPLPQDGYKVQWPDIAALTKAEKATIAATRTGAMSTYVQGGVEALMDPQDYLVRELDYTVEEAEEIIDARMNTDMSEFETEQEFEGVETGSGGKDDLDSNKYGDKFEVDNHLGPGDHPTYTPLEGVQRKVGRDDEAWNMSLAEYQNKFQKAAVQWQQFVTESPTPANISAYNSYVAIAADPEPSYRDIIAEKLNWLKPGLNIYLHPDAAERFPDLAKLYSNTPGPPKTVKNSGLEWTAKSDTSGNTTIVNLPEMTLNFPNLGTIQPPQINVQVPETQITVNVPKQDPSVVNVNVEAPQIPATPVPHVNVEAPRVTVEAPQVNVPPARIIVNEPTTNVREFDVIPVRDGEGKVLRYERQYK